MANSGRVLHPCNQPSPGLGAWLCDPIKFHMDPWELLMRRNLRLRTVCMDIQSASGPVGFLTIPGLLVNFSCGTELSIPRKPSPFPRVLWAHCSRDSLASHAGPSGERQCPLPSRILPCSLPRPWLSLVWDPSSFGWCLSSASGWVEWVGRTAASHRSVH